jgi:hypothetical protein
MSEIDFFGPQRRQKTVPFICLKMRVESKKGNIMAHCGTSSDLHGCRCQQAVVRISNVPIRHSNLSFNATNRGFNFTSEHRRLRSLPIEKRGVD